MSLTLSQIAHYIRRLRRMRRWFREHEDWELYEDAKREIRWWKHAYWRQRNG